MSEVTTRPDVSVLVLAYNHEGYIAECLDGILSQRFDGTFEVLVGEDCSTDRTRAVLDAYVRDHESIRLVTAPHNVGMHENHRRLVVAANGRYLAFCEGDDYWHDTSKLGRQVAILDSNPSLGGTHSDFDHVELRDGVWQRRRKYATRVRKVFGPQTTYDQLLERNLVQTCTLMLRTEATRAYVDSEFYAHRFLVGDWPQCLFVTSAHGPLSFESTSTATYRRTSGSVTNAGYEAEVRRIEDQHRMITLAARELRASPDHARRGHDLTDLALVLIAVRHGDRPRARAGATALRSSPAPTVRRAGTFVRVITSQGTVFRSLSALLRVAYCVRSRLTYR